MMTHTKARCCSALLVACCAVIAPRIAAAQLSDMRGAAGVSVETFTFKTPDKVGLESISLITIPFAARVPVAQSFEFGVSGAYASGKVSRKNGEGTTLSGPTDTELRLTYATASDRLRLSAVALAPTGKSKLSAAEMELTGVVASDLLPFAISNWGSGGGVGMTAAIAVPAGDASSVGLSAGYIVAHKYEPLSAASFAYRPGNQLQVRAAADRTFGNTAKGSLQFSYLHFGQDQSAGANFYQSGDRLQAVGSLAFAAGGRGTGLVYAGYLQRHEGQYTNAVQVTPAQDLVYAGAGFRQSAAGLVFVPTLDVRLLGNNAGVEQGRTISLGMGVEVPVRSVEVVPLARARFGHLTVRTAQESDFTGIELGLSIRTRAYSR